MADDPELAAIRASRMAQLQGQSSAGTEQVQKQEEAMRRELEMKNSLLTQILDQGARARLNSIALVKPERAEIVERMLIKMAQSGQISSKLNEESLVALLERVNKQTEKSTKITINRRRYAMDSDEDDY